MHQYPVPDSKLKPKVWHPHWIFHSEQLHHRTALQAQLQSSLCLGFYLYLTLNKAHPFLRGWTHIRKEDLHFFACQQENTAEQQREARAGPASQFP